MVMCLMPNKDRERQEIQDSGVSLTLRRVMGTEIKELIDICYFLDFYLGEENHPHDFYCGRREDESFVEAVYEDDKLIAAITAHILDDDLAHINSYFIEELDWSKPIGFIESVAVDADCRGQGYGKLLINQSMQWLRKQGCNEIVSLSWISGEDRQSLPLFKRLGYDEVEHFIEPWAGESCTVCGDDCKCNATLVYKRFQ